LYAQVGFDLATGGSTQANQGYEAEAIIDAVVTNTPIFVRTSLPSNGALAGSLVLNNIKLINVPTAVGVTSGEVVLSGGTLTIDSWGQGNVYSGITGQKTFTQGNIPAATKAASLLNSVGNIVSKGHPQYESYAVTQFVSARDHGCTGDGHTDDTVAINSLLAKVHTRRTFEVSSY
jgi:glucan 1,3-beta-glucosidase